MSTNLNYDRPIQPIVTAPAKEREEKKTVTTKRKYVSAEQRQQNRERRLKLERYNQQESRRAVKVQVDQNVILLSWIIGIGVAFLASAIVSFNGITSVAQFVGLSAAWMAGLLFFFVEIMYLLFLVAYLVLASRVDEEGSPERTQGPLWGMITFGGIAVLANAFHTFDYWEWAWAEPRMWAGIVLSVSAPIAIISASKMASRVVFARAFKLD